MGRTNNYRERNENEEQGNQPEGRKVSRLAVAACILFLLGIIAIFIYKGVKDNSDYIHEVVSVQEVFNQNRYIKYGDGYIKYNSDGAEARAAGKTSWNISYNMKKPIADVCGDFAAFADKGMQTLCITDGQGANYSINVPEKIVAISVAAQGVTAVWADALSKDHIYLYDVNGVLLIDIETSIADDGFPLSMDLSDDGKKLVTSYMRTEDEITSWVTFYNFGSVGQNYAGRVVGSYSFKGKIMPEVRFVNNERVCVFGEDECILYRMKEKPSELATQDTVRLSAVCSDSEHICLAESETDGTHTITVFDADGKSKKTIVTGLSYTGLSVGKEELIVYNNSSIIIYYLNGTEKYRTQIDGGIRNVFPAGEDQYTVIGGSEVRLIKLVKDKRKSEN